MKIFKFQLADTDLNKLVDYLINEISFDYENHSVDMTVLASEDYYLRNNSTQHNMLILKIKEESILIDVIGSAGGAGVFNLNWGSEKDFINKIKNILNTYCDQENLELLELSEQI